MEICKHVPWMRKIILTIILLLFAQTALPASIFDDLKKVGLLKSFMLQGM